MDFFFLNFKVAQPLIGLTNLKILRELDNERSYEWLMRTKPGSVFTDHSYNDVFPLVLQSFLRLEAIRYCLTNQQLSYLQISKILE